MRKTTDQKLAAARAKIIEWERKLRRASNKIKAYRQQEARLIRKANQEITEAAQARTGTNRRIDLPND